VVDTSPWGSRSDRETGLRKVRDRLRDIARVRRIVGVRHPNFVVVQTSHEWASILRDLALVAAIRRRAEHIVLQFHGGYAEDLVGPRHRLLKGMSGLMLRLVDGILVLSTSEARALEEFRPEARIHIVDNPFEPRASRASLHRSGSRDIVLFVGRLLVEKGIFETVDAVALLNPSVQLVVAGSGRSENDLVAHVRRRGVSDRVRLAGYLTSEELSAAYDEADVFVLPTYHPEGFPTAIAEAMSAGLPIVTTKTRGIGDHLRDEVNALFVPPRDHVALAQAIRRLFEDNALRERMSTANREAVSKFAPERVAIRYIASLRAIAES
jgi:glycosyltransferase involved in cell wall biosynthesis